MTELAILIVAWMCGTCCATPDPTATSVNPPQPGPPAFKIVVDRHEASMLEGDRTILRYRYIDVPFKPYVRELYTPNGLDVLRDAPEDHKHHHGLMFALAVDGVSFWAEEPGCGRQIHANTGVTVEAGRATWSDSTIWKIADDAVLRESRDIEVPRLTDNQQVTLLTWRTTLTPLRDLTLGGEHYYGLGMRFPAEMDRVGTFRNSSGQPGEIFRGEERLVPARWCAYSAKIDGKLVTVAMFDHPNNPRHPATWFTMATPFAYMSATLNLHINSMPLQKDQTLELCYGVAAWDGTTDDAQIEEMYKLWLDVVNPMQERIEK